MARRVGQLMQAGPVKINLLEKGRLRRHLHDIERRHIIGLVPAHAKIDAARRDDLLGYGDGFTLRERCGIGQDFILQPFTRSEEHTSELQSLMRISYAVFCLTKTKNKTKKQ